MTESILKTLDMARETAKAIRVLEAEAGKALHEENDPDTHRAKMIEKCELLADMPDKAAALLQGGGPEAASLLSSLKDFARRANSALDLESIFFMSALLYPEDYQDGDPNDLERFLDGFGTP